ncbi:hypothetical protein K0U83_22560, partial [bacterium]|nr:hypothetical protein [bacterium]
MPVVIAIANPLRVDERTVYRLPEGTSAGSVRYADWECAHVLVDGLTVPDDYRLSEEDTVVIYRVPRDLLTFAFVVQNLLISIAVSAAFALLFPPPKPKERRDDESSAVYGFRGVGNDRAEGNAVPVIYGTMKVGGTIINEFIQVAGLPPKSTLRQLIAFGEGPIASIGGLSTDTPAPVPLTEATIPNQVFINGNNAQNTADLKAWVRLGGNVQESVPGFNETRVTFDVQSDLTVPEDDRRSGAVTQQLITGFSVAGDDEFTNVNDALWENNAITFDFNSEDIDGFVWTLSFPSGYYTQNTSSGAIQSAFLGYQIRYIELDGAGSPIVTGGYAGDGYVRLPVVDPIALSERSGFQVQDSYRFEDPQRNTPATPGNKALTTASSGSNLSYAASVGGYAANQEVPFFTVFGWIKLSQGGPQELFSSIGPRAGASRTGFALSIENVSFTNGGIVPVLTLICQSGVETYKIHAGEGLVTLSGGNLVLFPDTPPATPETGLLDSSAVDTWLHIGASWQTGDKQSARLRLFINGQSVEYCQPGLEDEWRHRWGGLPLKVGNDSFASGSSVSYDELKCYNRLVDESFASNEYNNGFGVAGPVTGNGPFMCFRGPFEDSSGTSEYLTAEEWWAAVPTKNVGATSGVAGGVVRSGAAGNFKRGKWRVEILRTTRFSTSASVSNSVEVQAISSVLSQNFIYPTTPILGIEVDASEQLNGGIPTTTAIVQGRLCPVWDGISLALPTTVDTFTANPAWVALDLIVNKRYGLGRFYELTDVDLEQWKAWADYCDEIVFDGRPTITIENPGVLNDADLYFENTTVDPDSGEVRGGLWFEVGIEEKGQLPETWEVGYHLRLASFPTETAPGVSNDVNTAPGLGYEIYAVELLAGVWTVKCYWDRLNEADPWASGQRLGADVLTPADLNSAVVSGGSYRFEFNGVFDKTGSAWDALLDICAVGRAAPVPIGSNLSLRYSRTRSPIGVLSASNIIAGTFEVDFSSEKTRPNALTLSILDAQQNFEPVPVQVQNEDLDSVTNQSFIRQSNETLFGVTDAGQAERHGNFILLTNRFQKRSGKFKAALDALPYQVGDLLRVSSEVLPRGDSGRALASSRPSEPDALQDRQDFTGAAWAASSVTVTADTGPDPFGGNADTISGTGYVQQAINFTDNADGWVSVTVCAEQILNAAPRIELITDRATTNVDFDLSGLSIAASDSFDQPTRGSIQDLGGSNRYLSASFFVKAADGSARTTTMTLRIYPRAGALTGEARFSYANVTQAEYGAAPIPTRSVTIDREVTIEAATNYRLFIQDFRGNSAQANIDPVLTPVGTYPPGSTLFTTNTLATIAVRGSSYIVASSSEELIIEISGISRKRDMSAEFEWVEYREEVYADDAIEAPGGGALGDQRPATGLQPTSPPSSGATDSTTESTPGNFQLTMTVTWQNDPTTAANLLGHDVFWRDYENASGPQGGWTLGAQTNGLTGTASFILPGSLVGALVQTSVVPRTAAFPVQPPQSGSLALRRITGLAYRPDAPDSVSVELEDLTATYAAAFGDDDRGSRRNRVLRQEFRRGGWVLGQPIGLTDENSTSLLSRDFFVAHSGASVGRVHVRSRARSDTYSSEATVDPELTVLEAAYEPVSFAMGAATSWETFVGGGWYPPTPSVNGPAVSGALAEDADGFLSFTGAGLVGTYTTQWDNTTVVDASAQAPRQLLVTASVEADQVHPVTLGQMTTPLGGLALQRWSLEGPTEVAGDDLANCALSLQIRTNVDGTSTGWSDWQPFVCGVYTAVTVRMRILVTRPVDTYNVRIRRFHTNIIVPRRSNVEQGPTELHSRN